ncbi:hypothetical protein SKAU_G00046900 [Synaphobranchus kaupii]|uniref:Uncharacterized protein n=1 Tax=Synaphobranchus kaupii TaxID=118154 RepID=A0A9Q1G2D6_SYNKA|nr:hypothetical protein SKAU_G00046900 [Synaphobranchus kaupii]
MFLVIRARRCGLERVSALRVSDSPVLATRLKGTAHLADQWQQTGVDNLKAPLLAHIALDSLTCSLEKLPFAVKLPSTSTEQKTEGKTAVTGIKLPALRLNPTQMRLCNPTMFSQRSHDNTRQHSRNTI